MTEMQQDAVLENIIAGFDRMRTSTIRHASITSDFFNEAVREVPKEGVRAHHIAFFAEQSRRYPEADVNSLWGYYVSALASVCADKQSEISTDGLAVYPRNVGSYLTRGSLVVIGTVGNMFGYGMRSGKLTLQGTAQWGVGGGMTGGEIVIDGSCGQGVGDKMDGNGVIRVQGDYEALGRPIKGEIYLKGEKVWPMPSRRIRR